MSVAIDLSGKTVLITGASSGIGAETARVFHQAGATLALNHPGFNGTAEAIAELSGTLNSERNDSAFVFEADVSDASAVQQMMLAIQSQFGEIDYLINNAHRKSVNLLDPVVKTSKASKAKPVLTSISKTTERSAFTLPTKKLSTARLSW